MASEAQLTANRWNAQKSTGPRTAEGKAAASLNAVQHGLRAQAVVLPGEEPDEYRLHRQGMLEDLRPQDLAETDLAERIVELAGAYGGRAGITARSSRPCTSSRPRCRSGRRANLTPPKRGPRAHAAGGLLRAPGPGAGARNCTSGGSRAVWPGPGPSGASCPARPQGSDRRPERRAGPRRGCFVPSQAYRGEAG